MIRQLLLVNCDKWLSNPEGLSAIELPEPFDLKPIAWDIRDGMSHRAYLLTLSVAQYNDLKHTAAIDGVSLHDVGTLAKPLDIETFLASLGLERGVE